MDNIYTAIITNYNAWDRLRLCIKSFENQTIKPVAYIVTDDGSDTQDDDFPSNVTILHYPHEMKINKYVNDAVDACKTEKFYLLEQDALYRNFTMEALLQLAKPDIIVIPAWIRIKDPSYLPEYDNGEKKMSYLCIPPFSNPTGPFMAFKSTWLCYNEIYERAGYADTDYLYRWYMAGYKVYRTNCLCTYHYEHEHIGAFNDPVYINRNKTLFDALMPYYEKNKIFNLKEKRCLYPV